MRRKRLHAVAAAALLAGGLSACGGGGDDEPRYGPCIVQAIGPAFFVDSVRSATTGALIATVFLGAVLLDGNPFDLSQPSSVATNVRILGQIVECVVSCGFSDREGRYTFTVSAPGYATQTVTVDARYGSRTGSGCPLILSTGTRVSITLVPN